MYKIYIFKGYLNDATFFQKNKIDSYAKKNRGGRKHFVWLGGKALDYNNRLCFYCSIVSAI